ncbi:hypothetical protein [Planktothrix phage Pag-JY44]|nr:polysaccharide export protein [Aphanizomenon phage Yong-DA]
MSKVVRSAFIWNIGGFAVQVISLLAQTVIVSRLLTPEEVGIYFVSRSFLGILKSIPNSGAMYALASLPRLRNIHFRMMSGVISLAGLIQACVALLGCGVAYLWLGPNPMVIAIALLSFTCLFEGQQLTSESLMMRRLDYRPIVTADAVSFAASITTILALSPFINSFLLLTIAAYSESIARLIALKVPTWHETKLWIPKWRIIRKTLNHSFKITLSRLLSLVATQGDKIIVGGALGAGAAGNYGRGQNLINAPLTAYGRVVNKVLMPAAANEKLSGVSLSWVTSAALTLSVRFGIFAGVAMWVLGRPVVDVLLGPGWGDVAIVLQITGLLIVFRFLFKALDSVVVGQRLVKPSIIGQAIQGGSSLVALFVGVQFGLAGACWAVSLAQFLSALYYIYAVLKHKMITVPEMLASLGKSTLEAGLLSLPVFGAYWLLESAQAGTWVKIIVLGLLLAAWGGYVVLSLKKSGLGKKKKKKDSKEEESEERAALPPEPMDLDG